MSPYEVRTRWGDLDALGHVGHTVVPIYLEQGRDAFLAEHGIRRDEYVVARCTINYLNEIDADADAVTVECGVRELGRTSLTTDERILDAGGRVLVEAEFTLVLWDPEERVSRVISDRERASLAPIAEVHG